MVSLLQTEADIHNLEVDKVAAVLCWRSLSTENESGIGIPSYKEVHLFYISL